MPHLGVLFVATTGLQEDALGDDEHEIGLLQFALLGNDGDITYQESFYLDTTTEFSPETKVYLNLNCGDNQQKVTLQEAIDTIRNEVGSTSLVLFSYGQNGVRQGLHPEASTKDIQLPDYFYSFVDIAKCGQSLEQLCQEFSIVVEPSEGRLGTLVAILVAMVKKAGSAENLLLEFHVETVMKRLEPGICTKHEVVDGQCVVRARGLPWQSSDQDVAKFFRGLNIVKGGVALCLSSQGRRNGEALVRFESEEHRDLALKRHKHHIGNRYIEVYKAQGEDFINVAGGTNNEAQTFLSRGGQVIIRMRGLPYDTTPKQVLEFFEQSNNNEGDDNEADGGVKVHDGEDGVLFVKRADGRATGDAFVLFSAEEDAAKALAKHKQSIGTRYIELFRSTTAEVQQVLNRCLEPPVIQKQQQQHQQQQINNNLLMSPVLTPPPLTQSLLQPPPPLVLQQHHQSSPLLSPPLLMSPQSPPHQQQVITCGTRKDCIRLRGLPYEAQVEHILEFLGEHAKNIVFQGVHMVYNAQGQPSGEAFIQMSSEQAAYMAALAKHHRYMLHFKKQRYIEVFQCSGDDMNLVLTGSVGAAGGGNKLPSPPSVSSSLLAASSTLPNGVYYNNHHLIKPIFYYYNPPPHQPPPPPPASTATPLHQIDYVYHHHHPLIQPNHHPPLNHHQIYNNHQMYYLNKERDKLEVFIA